MTGGGNTVIRAILPIVALLLVLLTPIPALAEPLPPAYYLPTDAEMLLGFQLTEASGPAINPAGTAYQETRSYTRAAPFTDLLLSAGISPNPTVAHGRLTGLTGIFSAQGFTAIPAVVGDESAVLFKLTGTLDSYMLLWRTGSLIGSVQLVAPASSISPHDAGQQLGQLAQPMLNRMAAHPGGV